MSGGRKDINIFLPDSQQHTGYYIAFNLIVTNDLKLSKVFKDHTKIEKKFLFLTQVL